MSSGSYQDIAEIKAAWLVDQAAAMELPGSPIGGKSK